MKFLQQQIDSNQQEITNLRRSMKGNTHTQTRENHRMYTELLRHRHNLFSQLRAR